MSLYKNWNKVRLVGCFSVENIDIESLGQSFVSESDSCFRGSLEEAKERFSDCVLHHFILLRSRSDETILFEISVELCTKISSQTSRGQCCIISPPYCLPSLYSLT